MPELVYINNDNFNPETIYDIDLETSIVASLLENNNIFKDDKHHLYLCAKTDIMLQNLKMIGNTNYILDFNPNIKWSIPKGIDVMFNTPSTVVNDIIAGIFTDTILYDEEPLVNNLMSYKFCLHIDKERTKNAVKILSGTRLLVIHPVETIFNGGYVSHIYVIQNNYIYDEFKLHFDRPLED